MARKKKELVLDSNVLSAYSNIDATISDRLLRMQLLNARKARRLSQKELSKLSGLSESCISNIESGDKASPTLRSLIKYATALDIEICINPIPNKEIQAGKQIYKEIR